MTDLVPTDYDVPLPLFDHPTEPFRNSDPDTAREAARTLDGANDRAEVLAALIARGGDGTADEVCDWLNEHGSRQWFRNVVSSRLSQLKDAKRYPNPPVRDSGKRRPSNAGKSVIVFEVVA